LVLLAAIPFSSETFASFILPARSPFSSARALSANAAINPARRTMRMESSFWPENERFRPAELAVKRRLSQLYHHDVANQRIASRRGGR
jgi:hypothetical protein